MEYFVLCLCVFTLTIAYAALSAVLTISGNARVSAADWDVYLSNPKVTSGSVSTDAPHINGTTASFSTTLNMPGDFYEFTIDVVNDGSINAIIESVTKIPSLTEEQSKYLKYEITYLNGDMIESGQLLAKETSMPIKVRIEYRKDLNASDLPTGQVVLDLSFTVDYIQSDNSSNSGSGSSVQISANGDINGIGTIVTIGSEQFYTVGTNGNNVKLLSMYNLHVGYILNESGDALLIENPTGMQDSSAKGNIIDEFPRVGTTQYSDVSSDYSGSVVEGYVNNYKNILESTFGVSIVEARLITKDELASDDIGCSETQNSCKWAPKFITATSYWCGSKSATEESYVWYVRNSGEFIDNNGYGNYRNWGVRPLIIISKDYFN